MDCADGIPCSLRFCDNVNEKDGAVTASRALQGQAEEPDVKAKSKINSDIFVLKFYVLSKL